ncbi:MAG: FtsX-like permease family protein [FCB group bacterium]|nr:FtsX-like permease family protein [FCB group bacterium]
MIPLHTIKQFFNDMRRQKLRTMMTMFGIFWGTCSIVLLFAFGKGLTEQQIKSQKGMGENIAIFWSGITSKEFKGLPKGRHIRPTENDVKLIKRKVENILRISPEYSRWNVTLKYGKNSTLRGIVGVWPEYGEMRNVIPEFGSRFINERDMKEKRRVIFIGDKLKEDLFGEKEAVGKRILVNGTPFMVIGVMEHKKQNSSYSGRDNRKGFLPSSTFQTMFSRRFVDDFVVQCQPTVAMESVRHDIFKILGAKYKFDPTDDETLSVWDTTEGFAFLRNFFSAFQMFLVGIGIATLITGGIGVSNIMNVVLEERTKEIGIKMALGARKSYILWQFIAETFLITAVGGVLGFLFAWGIISIFPLLHLEEYIGIPRIDLWGGIMVTIVLGIVGLVAGFFPARRAANLQPVQALKLF